MTSAEPPNPWFPTINFNEAFFSSNITTITLPYANATYLKRIGIATSVASLTTFSGDVEINGASTFNSTADFNGTTTFDADATFSQNIISTGTGKRFQADFTNATNSNRLCFQSSTLNGQSGINVIPNGTNQQSSTRCFNGSDPNNSALITQFALGSGYGLQGLATGTGVVLPLTIRNNTITGISLDTSANVSIPTNLTMNGLAKRFQADFDNATFSNRLFFQTSTLNGFTSFGMLPNGTSTSAGNRAFNNSDPTNAGAIAMTISSANASLGVAITGTGTYVPLNINNGGATGISLDTSANVSIPTNLTISNPITCNTTGVLANISNGGYTSNVKVVPYNSVASTGGQVQIGGGIDTTNNAGRLSVVIGTNAGATNQGTTSVAIGTSAGETTQGNNCVAIGSDAGYLNQQLGAVAIGNNAGGNTQGANSVAIGRSAGEGTTSAMGANSVAIGFRAGVASQTAGSICLNASGVALNPNQAGFFVNPIRAGALGSSFTPALPAGVLYYSGNEILRTT